MKFEDLKKRCDELEEQLAVLRRSRVRALGVRLTGRSHQLRTWPEPFQAIVDGRKLYEVRRDDRGYAVGDVLELREWDPSFVQANKRVLTGENEAFQAAYTGRELLALVTYMTTGGAWGLPADRCVLSLALVTEDDVAALAALQGAA